MLPRRIARVLLLAAALETLTVGVLTARASATPPATCPGDGCYGGKTQCAKLPNGSICYTIP